MIPQPYLTKFNSPYYDSLDDFFVTKISTDEARQGEYWQLALNFRRATLGGSQTRVLKADSVVWALIKEQQAPANGLPLLKLKGPRSSGVGKEIVVIVIDGETRQAVQGATVKEIQAGGTGAWTTDYQGQAKIKFATEGAKELKAGHEGKYVRSNALSVTVHK
jgi:hypothetical protein